MPPDDSSAAPPPLGASSALADAVPRDLCTDCGISRTDAPRRCGRACQFIRPDFAARETEAHGRPRAPEGEELHFGVHRRMRRVALSRPRPGAQWTGLTTRLAERLLETGAVTGVLACGPSPEDRWRPEPRLCTTVEQVAACRGMRMGWAPLLALLEPAVAAGHTRLAVIGIPCQVHALRALEAELGLERLYVIGTPCSDNTTTENFHKFLALLDARPETISYLEFRADYRVEIRHDDGRVRTVPFLKLPISKLPADFFPMTCRTCTDYVNALADVTVGYMAGEGEQWLIERNDRGAEIAALVEDELLEKPLRSKGRRKGAVAGFLKNVERAAGGLPLRAMPDWARPIVAWLQPRIGPRGLEFARARVEMKAVETVLHLRAAHPRRIKHMVPDHVWRLVAPYGLTPTPGERAGPASPAPPDAGAAPRRMS
ncbi:MAG: Coenzyme F420 hydrogenase/dehydrogenase, beta subunit C-terminal domain [Pseudomonadota bacterium]